MPKAEREQYLGKPDIIDGLPSFTLSSHLEENLSDLCSLVLEVFGAQRCDIAAIYEQNFIGLHSAAKDCQAAYSNIFSALEATKFKDFVHITHRFKSQSADSLVVAVPINLAHNVCLGCLVFARQNLEPLTNKEKRILKMMARDATNFFIQRKESFAAEKFSELQSLVLETNQDWIFVKDRDFKIVYANDAFLNVYPEDMRDRVIGYTTIEEYNEEEAAVFLRDDKIAFAEGSSNNIEDIHLPDGSHTIVATTKTRFEDKLGTPYILCVCRDITEKETLIRDLKKANQELDDFTSIASHDLKAPLNAIRRLLTWIEDESGDSLSENARENMRFVVSRAERMHTLLNDLLRFAKIGRETPNNVQLSLKSAVDEMRLLIDVPEHCVLTSEELLMYVPLVPMHTVLLNLISNAFKHNDKSTPKVNIEAFVSKHYYVIKIIDNGPGIAPRYQEKVFKLFQTLRPRDEVEGSGMGLSVVKKYVDYYGGRVTLESDGQHGTTFTVYWPVGKLTERIQG
jgi:PAS domain S-box-containing protein